MKKWLIGIGEVLLVSTLFGGVMMQGFYWDVPAGGTWWDTMKSKAYELRYMEGGYGINRIWFPPASKGQTGATSMGYDPHDYYDLGQYYQDGTTETRFGSQAELKSAIATFKGYGVSCMADIVPNHRSGGASEYNPYTGGNTWTDFRNVASGKAMWQYSAFHPNNIHSADEGTFAGFPDVCHNQTFVMDDLKAWMNWLKDSANAGFDSWRYDYVKGYGGWVVQQLNSATSPTFSVGECWDGSVSVLDSWVSASGTSVFDFALYYTLRDICNNTSGGGYLPNVFNTGMSYAAKNPLRAVTFVGNHDTDEITTDKMMAYAFILTYQGYPCIWWKDYYNYGLATGGGAGTSSGNGIKKLVWVREKLGGGSPNIEILKSDDGDLIIYGSKGSSTSAPGYIVAINDSPSSWKSAQVTTGNSYLKGQTLVAYAWSSTVSGQNYQPASVSCSSTGVVTVSAPPRGYAVYSISTNGTSGTTTNTNTTATTTVKATYDVGYGNTMYIRGSVAPLSWDKGIAMTWTTGNVWTWSTTQIPAGTTFEYKVLINDTTWSDGANYVGTGGQTMSITPTFNGNFYDTMDVITQNWVVSGYTGAGKWHNYNYMARAYGCTTESIMTLKWSLAKVTNAKTVTLAFKRQVTGLDSGEYLAVDVYNGTSWVQVASFTGTLSLANVSYNVTQYKNANFKVRFRTKMSSTSEYSYVDNVSVAVSF
ncbi:MAG: hypothetical protein HPY78_01965 [Brevinematales bacterium]|nr:hypothetical protein [Brevinematales bacterium]